MAEDPEPIDDTRAESSAPRAPTGGRFAPGELVANRYRIIERLGAGAMGEVYHAEDTRLEQHVALKFLSGAPTSHGHARDLMLNEIRTARRITHPNVCRLHDLGDLDGQPFVSMEYVRGEDLSSLLRRIGRLHGDKADQIARQICSGLQAAHDQGVLHRDLKPSNILVDERGNIRISDFGIAAGIETASDSSPAGSPAYMAPELFTGGSASVASDLYSLGLVLHELYTGERLFQADSMTTLLAQHREPIEPPSRVVSAVDRQVDAAVLACLQHDARHRPESAIAVLAMLPGADPLAEALAAGQTPSPSLVAAAVGRTLSWQRALWLAAATLLLLVAIAWVDPSIRLLSRVDAPLPESVLVHRARTIAADCGQRVSADAHGFRTRDGYLHELEARELTEPRWDEHLRSDRVPPLTFWFRGSARGGWLRANNIKGRVGWRDPARFEPGMVRIELDTDGDLILLEQRLPPGDLAETTPPDDSALFQLAGLDPNTFIESEPRRLPTSFADSRRAWASRDDETMRVEVARLDGWPVLVAVVDTHAATETAHDTLTSPFSTPWRVLWTLIAGAMALRAIRRRQIDASGATRAALGVFALVTVFTVLTANHGGDWSAVGSLFLLGMSHGLAVAAELAIYYLAFEPHARRIWPQALTSWNRLLIGKVRDPLVAGGLLIGALVGCASALLSRALHLAPRALGEPELAPLVGRDVEFESLMGLGHSIGVICEIGVDAVRDSMLIFVVLVALRLLVRKPILAASLTSLVFAVIWHRDYPGATTSVVISWVILIGLTALVVFSAVRYGLLAIVVAYTTQQLLETFPSRPDLDAWYVQATLMPLIGIGGTLGFALFSLWRRGVGPHARLTTRAEPS